MRGLIKTHGVIVLGRLFVTFLAVQKSNNEEKSEDFFLSDRYGDPIIFQMLIPFGYLFGTKIFRFRL